MEESSSSQRTSYAPGATSRRDFVKGMGAVSGQQWMGPRKGMNTPEGFGVIDVRPDGTFDWSYQTYGWQAPPEAIAAQGE